MDTCCWYSTLAVVDGSTFFGRSRMRINLPHILYAIRHPLRTVRYIRSRDKIPYEVIARHLPVDPVILEAGAHDGTNTVEMAEFWPRATIHAFEPIPSAADRTSDRIGRYGARVACHRLALGPCDGEVEMYVSGDGSSGSCQSSSMLSPTLAQQREFPMVTFGLTTKVPLMTIDSWASRHNVSRIDFLWLDMQGYELRALEGASRLLRTASAIHIEVSNIRLYAGAPLYPEVVARMAAWGFRPIVEAIFRIGGNVLFVRT